MNIKNGIIQDSHIGSTPIFVKIVQPKGLKNVRTLTPLKALIGITIHNTGNKTADDSDHAKWLQNVETADKLYVSPHLFIDEDSITQVIPLNEVGYHAGDGKGDGNMKTIGIEICENGDIKKAEQNAIAFCAALKTIYPELKIFKHQDWNGKYCPHLILKRNGWQTFVNDVNKAFLAGQSQPTKDETKVPPSTYVVKKGDTLYGIAKQLKMPLKTLMALNPSVKAESLKIGLELKVN